MNKPLVISRSYLWDKCSTGQVQRVFWEYMHNHGVNPTIICSDCNQNNVPLERIKCNIIQTHDNQLFRYIIALLKRVVAADFAYLPDYARFSWYYSTLKRVKKEAQSGQYDYIFSVCTPYTAHLIALETKKLTKLPWVAWFYDPWFENPYRPFKYKRFYEQDKKYEAEVALNADVIIHSNQAIYDEWVERYGEIIRKKMFIVPFMFNDTISDTTDYSIDNPNPKYVISHIGSLYPNRDSVDFLKSVKLLLENHPDLKDKFIINYVGTITENDRKCVSEFGLKDITNFAGFLSEQECIKYFRQSDLFLALDGKNARNIFFPSKIMKYFYYGKPILGMTPKGSALQYELEKSNNYCFENEDYQGIAQFLFRAITEESFPKGYDKSYWKYFTMDSIYPQYEKIIKDYSKKN